MLLRPRLGLWLHVSQPLEHNIVGSLAVESDLAAVPQDDRHALPDVVEVEDAEDLVHLLPAQRPDRDGGRRAGEEDEAEVTRRGD